MLHYPLTNEFDHFTTGFECRFTVSQGVTFQTSGGGMPGIVVQNMYIHNTGPGAYHTNGPVVGSDPGGYLNQLDFEDFGQGADGVQFLNNVVKWCGGHNCLEVHEDSGPVVVQGSAVEPGCVHGCIDTKGVGTPKRAGDYRFKYCDLRRLTEPVRRTAEFQQPESGILFRESLYAEGCNQLLTQPGV